jgi:hypothetical protein
LARKQNLAKLALLMTPSGKKEFRNFRILASMKEGNAMIIAFHTAKNIRIDDSTGVLVDPKRTKKRRPGRRDSQFRSRAT